MLMPRTPALQDEKAPYQSMVLRRIRSSALFLGSLCLSGCLLCDKGRPGREDLSIYRATNDQAAHDCVKTEQFIVPVGSVIVIQGLDFKPGVTRLSRFQERIATQIFNCIEEITENTLGDTNAARVTGFKKMEFEILGFPDGTGGSDSSALIAQARADWGMAIEPVAKMYGLGFLPLSPEEYDFLLVESRKDRPAVQAFLKALRDPKTKERIRALGMQPAE